MTMGLATFVTLPGASVAELVGSPPGRNAHFQHNSIAVRRPRVTGNVFLYAGKLARFSSQPVEQPHLSLGSGRPRGKKRQIFPVRTPAWELSPSSPLVSCTLPVPSQFTIQMEVRRLSASRSTIVTVYAIHFPSARTLRIAHLLRAINVVNGQPVVGLSLSEEEQPGNQISRWRQTREFSCDGWCLKLNPRSSGYQSPKSARTKGAIQCISVSAYSALAASSTGTSGNNSVFTTAQRNPDKQYAPSRYPLAARKLVPARAAPLRGTGSRRSNLDDVTVR